MWSVGRTDRADDKSLVSFKASDFGCLESKILTSPVPSLGNRPTTWEEEDCSKKETITLPIEGKFGFSRKSTVIYVEVFTCLYQLGEYCTFIFLAHFKHYYCFILLLLQLKTAESKNIIL